MKRILLCCGSGIATSTAVNNKVTEALEARGHKGEFMINQAKISEVAAQSSDYDLCITTALYKGECACPLIVGTCFLMGRGVEPVVDQICEILFGSK